MLTTVRIARISSPDDFALMLEQEDAALVDFARSPANLKVRAEQDALRSAARKTSARAASMRLRAALKVRAEQRAACDVVTVLSPDGAVRVWMAAPEVDDSAGDARWENVQMRAVYTGSALA